MRKTKSDGRRLVIKRDVVRILGGRELTGVAAGWECSAKTSGNIQCSPLGSGDSEICEPVKPS